MTYITSSEIKTPKNVEKCRFILDTGYKSKVILYKMLIFHGNYKQNGGKKQILFTSIVTIFILSNYNLSQDRVIAVPEAGKVWFH